jgi:hypothetical protein
MGIVIPPTPVLPPDMSHFPVDCTTPCSETTDPETKKQFQFQKPIK